MSSKGISRNSWIVLKQAWNIAGLGNNNRTGECGNSDYERYLKILNRYFGTTSREDVGVYCLITAYNHEKTSGSRGFGGNPFEEISPEEVLVPNIYSYDAEFIEEEYQFDNYYDECSLTTGNSKRYEIECECLNAIKEGYDEEGEYYEEDCIDHFGTDDECECTEYEEPMVELFRWRLSSGVYYSLQDDLANQKEQNINEIVDNDVIIIEEGHVGHDEEWETWDYFDSSKGGELIDWSVEKLDFEVELLIK